jgi:VanZ family protein
MLAQSRLWLLALLVWFIALFVLSGQSRLKPPGPEFNHKDKVIHATYFMLGGTCLYLALRLKKPAIQPLLLCVVVIGFCSLVGASDEFHQSFVPNRSGNDWGDWLADTVGGALACGLGLLLYRVIRRKPTL